MEQQENAKTELSLLELKSQAYDIIEQIESYSRAINSLQQQLQQVNNQIVEKKKIPNVN